MANLTLVYGMRLLPADEIASVGEAPIQLKNGNEAHVTMHVLEGSREQIEAQLRMSLDAFFDFYPEIWRPAVVYSLAVPKQSIQAAPLVL